MKWLRYLGMAVLGILAALAVAAWMAVHTTQERQHADRSVSAPASGQFVQAADARIFVQRAGDPHAPALVFIHGTGAWSEVWRPSMATAVQAGFQAVALDVPPFGYSSVADG